MVLYRNLSFWAANVWNGCRSNGGGEYVWKILHDWIESRGIVHSLTSSYSPESSGRAEQLNRTLLDMARSMIMGLEMKNRGRYWAETINCANYLRNRLHTSICKNSTTPYEAIHDKDPGLSHIRFFCSKTFDHMPKAKQRGKFDPSVEERILIGYERGKRVQSILSLYSKVVYFSRSWFYGTRASYGYHY